MRDHDRLEVADRESYLKLLNKTTVFIAPPPSFNPAVASNAQLREIGLPTRPNRATRPLLSDLWHLFFSGDVRFIQEQFSLSTPVPFRHSREMLPATSTTLENSANWSGAYIEPNHGRTIGCMIGIWTVPKVTIAPTSSPSSSGDYFSSMFIGIDGQRRYLDSTLPQIGTRQNIISGKAVYEAWYEWFALGEGSWPIKMALPVSPGHTVFCFLSVLSPTSVLMMIRNLDTPWIMAFKPPLLLPIPNATARISGATAEWILERPTGLKGNVETLPDFGKTTFEICLATAYGKTAGLWLHNLTGARLIRMLEERQEPHRSALISVPSLQDYSAFDISYFKD